MPEGPEIKRAADRLSRVLCGQLLINIYFYSEGTQSLRKILEGSRVEAVTTRGKALLTSLDSGYTIYSHNQLYGRWNIVKAGNFPKTKRSLRMALDTQSHRALLFSASDINILQSEAIEDHPFLAKIGPDILDEGLTWKVVSRRLLSDKFRNRQLASLFLDQSFLAGSVIISDLKFLRRKSESSKKTKGTCAKKYQSDQPKYVKNLSAGLHPKWSNKS